MCACWLVYLYTLEQLVFKMVCNVLLLAVSTANKSNTLLLSAQL